MIDLDRGPAGAAAAPPAVRWIGAADLPAVPLEAGQLARMLSSDGALFATEAAAAWAGLEPLDACAAWSAAGASEPGAVLGVAGGGLRSRLRCYHVGAGLAVFLQRRWSPADDARGGATPRAAVEGAFHLIRRMQNDVRSLQEQGRWPVGQRLVLLDDDFDRQRWGWSAPGRLPDVSALLADDRAYLAALVSLQTLKTR